MVIKKMQNMSEAEIAEAFESGTYLCELQGCEKKRTTNCEDCVEHWLKSEHKVKPKLSDAERVILENLPKEYKWIARDDTQDFLWIFTEKPTKNHRWWANESNFKIGVSLSLFNHLFQFIKWKDEEPYNIEELLKGE